MAQQAEDAAPERVAALEAVAWRARTRLQALSARAARLETEREAGASQQALLLRERQALLEENERLRQQAADLTERLDRSLFSLDAARDKVAFLQRQLATRFLERDRFKKERAGLSRLLGRAVCGLLGAGPGRRPSRRVLAAGVKALNRIGLVDPDWYKAAYPDVAASGMDPVLHYLRHGSLEGRDPRNPAGE